MWRITQKKVFQRSSPEIEKAEAVRNDPDASSEDIQSAAKSLNSAVDLAEPVNLAELQKAYDEARRIPNDNYTGSTWANLQNSLSAATELLIGSGRTYEKVEAAIQAIEDAVAGLRYNLDLSALRALVNECSDLLEDDYEAAEWPAVYGSAGSGAGDPDLCGTDHPGAGGCGKRRTSECRRQPEGKI